MMFAIPVLLLLAIKFVHSSVVETVHAQRFSNLNGAVFNDVEIENGLRYHVKSTHGTLKDALSTLVNVGSIAQKNKYPPTYWPTEAPTRFPSPLPTEEPTNAPVSHPTEEPTIIPTLFPTEVPTALSTQQTISIVGTVQAITLYSVGKNCTYAVQDSTFLLAVTTATMEVSNVDNAIFWKCIQGSNGETAYPGVKRRRLIVDSSMQLFVNTSTTLPPNSNVSVILQTQKSIAESIVTSVNSGTYTSILQNVSKALNVTSLKSATAENATVSTGVTTYLQDPPTAEPTLSPTNPTYTPTQPPLPSFKPTRMPSAKPTRLPSSHAPVHGPTYRPTRSPSLAPTPSPGTEVPSTESPSLEPATSTEVPTTDPTLSPSVEPFINPIENPTLTPSLAPSISPITTEAPSITPTSSPNESFSPPTSLPSSEPTESPTIAPNNAPNTPPTNTPTESPTIAPTNAPNTPSTITPTESPTIAPTNAPNTNTPTESPTIAPTNAPNTPPSSTPTESPTTTPTTPPTSTSTESPTTTPNTPPTSTSTESPTIAPTNSPNTSAPTESPTITSPIEVPTSTPTSAPSGPTEEPTLSPTISPVQTSDAPSIVPSDVPTGAPTTTATPTNFPTANPTTVDNIEENLNDVAVINFSGVNGDCATIRASTPIQHTLEVTNDRLADIPSGSSHFWKCENVARRSLSAVFVDVLDVSSSITIYLNMSVPIPVGSGSATVDTIRKLYTDSLNSAVSSGTYAVVLQTYDITLFPTTSTITSIAIIPGSTSIVSVSPATELSVSILSATFETKTVPIRESKTSCLITGYNDIRVLSVILKVTNVGSLPLLVNPNDLKQETCSNNVNVFPTFYQIDIGNTTKTRSEKCVSDSVAPISFTCNNMGISPGNYFISTQWVDVSQSDLVAGHQYTVYVSALPRNPMLKAVSEPFTIIYSNTRRRNLRVHRSKSIGQASQD